MTTRAKRVGAQSRDRADLLANNSAVEISAAWASFCLYSCLRCLRSSDRPWLAIFSSSTDINGRQ